MTARERTLNDLPVTVVTDAGDVDVLVPRPGLGAARADAVVLAVTTAAPAIAPLVVDRTGTPLWGAAAGGDLLDGDRIVTEGRRSFPLLVGIGGPLDGTVRSVRDLVGIGPDDRLAMAADRDVDDRAGDDTGTDPSPTPDALLESRPAGVRLTATGRGPVTVDGVEVTGTVDLLPGARIGVGGSLLLLVTDPPPAPGKLLERGHVFFRPERLPLDSPWSPLPELLSAIVTREPPLWGLVPGHPHHLAAPNPLGGPVRPLQRERAVAVLGEPSEATAAITGWLARLVALQDPARFRLRVDPGESGVLAGLADPVRWLPHHVDQPLPRPAWQHLPVLQVVEPGAPALASGERGDLQVWVAPSRRGLPAGAEVVADLRDATITGDRLAPEVFAVLTRALAPVAPTVPAEPFPET